MNIKSFLKLVEIQTKVASIIPFLLGTAYVIYRFDSFIGKNFILMLISLLSIDMATTAINNYQDFKKAIKKEGYGYESHNAIVSHNLNERSVKITIAILLLSASVFGFWLFIETNIIVLGLGMVSFLLGVSYSYGPIPISRTPFGELFSGLFMGGVITFLAVYINLPDAALLGLSYNNFILDIKVNVEELVFIALLTLPAIAGIANIMLANNICDMHDDLENMRCTLPIYVGKEKALIIYKSLYYAGFLSIAVLITIGVLPIICAISLISIIPVQKNINLFYKSQLKNKTFATAVNNFAFVNIALILSIGAGIIIKTRL
ncbi:MAG: 1,4-dihydroxy-2-naphthoate polyprenyltransferase [Eubacteriales bacterium]